MNISWYVTRNSRGLFSFLKQSFPNLTFAQFQRINAGKHFTEWACGESFYQGSYHLTCCTAIFSAKYGYKMGLFCVNPRFRRQGIGKTFFQKLVERYHYLTWTAKSEESLKFYQSIGAVNKGIITGIDGTKYTLFGSK